MPVIIRVDGKAFHSYTKGCKKPFDVNLMTVMNETAMALCDSIQGAQIAYVQSDEISVLVHNYKKLSSSAWFDNQVQKDGVNRCGNSIIDLQRQLLEDLAS